MHRICPSVVCLIHMYTHSPYTGTRGLRVQVLCHGPWVHVDTWGVPGVKPLAKSGSFTDSYSSLLSNNNMLLQHIIQKFLMEGGGGGGEGF